MNDSIPDEKTIIIDGKVSLDDYRIYWRDAFFRDLPNTLIFWGTLAGGALAAGLLFRDGVIGLFFLSISFLAVAIPVFMTSHNYRGFMTAMRKHVESLSEAERHFNIIVKPDGEGIEFMQGKNFSFISWDSIKSALEREKYFSLDLHANPLLIMKREFSGEADIESFRNTLAGKFGANAKLLR